MRQIVRAAPTLSFGARLAIVARIACLGKTLVLALLKRHLDCFIGAYNRWERDDGPLMSAAVAYYLGLSFFPLLLILIAAVGLFFRFTHSGQDAQQAILAIVRNNLSESIAVQVREALDQVRDTSVYQGPVALVMMLISSMAAFVQLERAFDRIGEIPASENKGILAGLRLALFERVTAFVMLCGLGLLIVAVFVANLVLSAMRVYADRILPGSAGFWWPTRLVLSFGVNVALFAALYHWLPRTPIRFKEAIRGGLIAAVIWEIGRQVLARFLIGTKYTDAYGVVGSFIAVMLWCYYAVAVLLLGAEYIEVACSSRAHSRRDESTTGDRAEPSPPRPG